MTRARLTLASDGDQEAGLVGYLQLEFGGVLQIDGATLRRTAAGRLAVSFPCRSSGQGTRHAIVRILDPRVRRDVERQALALLGLDAEGREVAP